MQMGVWGTSVSGTLNYEFDIATNITFTTGLVTQNVNSIASGNTATTTFTGGITNQAGGEAPTFVVMSPGDYATLNNDFIGIEQQYINPGSTYTMDTAVRSSFPNLNVSGIPIFAAPGLHPAALQRLQAHVPAGGRVLELGAGGGALSQRMADAGYRVSACDLFENNFTGHHLDDREGPDAHQYSRHLRARVLFRRLERQSHLDDY